MARRKLRGISWLFGLALIVALILVVRHRAEERSFAELSGTRGPAGSPSVRSCS